MGEKLNIFVDLEETLIDEFSTNPKFLVENCTSIKRFISNTEHSHMFLFSFAIHDTKDVEIFAADIQPILERVLDKKFSHIVTVPQMFKVTQKALSMRFGTLSDFILERGKELAFHDWCRAFHRGEANILIDDVVHNRMTIDIDDGTSMETINVKKVSKTLRKEKLIWKTTLNVI